MVNILVEVVDANIARHFASTGKHIVVGVTYTGTGDTEISPLIITHRYT